MSMRCCCGWVEAEPFPPKPFERMVVLEFYDGPTSGLLQCAACGAEYHFDMLDWDGDHEVRVFRLAALPAGSLDRFVSALAKVEEPHWPVWLVFGRKRPSEKERDLVDGQLQAVLRQAAPAELVVAWSGYGDRLLAAQKVPASELSGVPTWFSREEPEQARDWFGLLGLSKDQVNAQT